MGAGHASAPVGIAVVTCMGPAVKALFARGTCPRALVEVEFLQRGEDKRLWPIRWLAQTGCGPAGDGVGAPSDTWVRDEGGVVGDNSLFG